MLARLLGFLGGHGPRVLFFGIFVGLALPDLAALCRPLLAPAVVALLLATLLRVDWRAVAGYARRPVLAALLVLWFLVLSPVLVWLALPAFAAPGSLSVALVLMAAAPPILAATSIAILLGLDSALALLAGLISTLLTPLTLPPLALALLGLELDIGVGSLMLRLAAVVVGAFLGAAVIRRLAPPGWLESRSGAIDGLVVAIMLVFAIAIMDGVTATLLARPGMVALWLLAAFIANPTLQALGGLAFFWLGRRRALTVGLLTGNCNMGLLLAALPPGTDYGVVLFFAIAQLPMFTLPALLLPIYRRLLSPGAGGAAGKL